MSIEFSLVYFGLQEQHENALAMYDKVVDSWYKHLVALKSSGSDDISSMSEAQASEVSRMWPSTGICLCAAIAVCCGMFCCELIKICIVAVHRDSHWHRHNSNAFAWDSSHRNWRSELHTGKCASLAMPDSYWVPSMTFYLVWFL